MRRSLPPAAASREPRARRPTGITQWLTSADEAARERTLDAVWKMQKLDIATLERAHQGW
jgi:hypothetical protein